MDTNIPDETATFTTLIDTLKLRAKLQPNQRAFTFLVDGENEEAMLTYAQLDQFARTIAGYLQKKAVVGDRALLLYPSGFDFIVAFFGCLYAGVVAIPVIPLNDHRPDVTLSRLKNIAHDAEPRFLLTLSSYRSEWERRYTTLTDNQKVTWIETDTIPPNWDENWREPKLNSDSLAYLQYSSGSTGTPKGICLTYRNVLHNLRVIQLGYEHDKNTRMVNWAPLHHDLGLVGGVLQPIYGGYPVVILDPVAFVQRPIRWLSAITRYRATTSGGPNFAYELCVRRITDEQKTELDLSSWSVAFSGAERVRQKTIEEFTVAFEPCGFRAEAFVAAYGLAEATLMVTCSPKPVPPVYKTIDLADLNENAVLETPLDREKCVTLVSCGTPCDGLRVIVANLESLTENPAGRIGEIWVSGDSVAREYWRNPTATMATFRAYLSDTNEGPFLRTGDLGFMDVDGIFVTGRLKDLIIIRGQNFFPDDIELTTEQCHPSIRPGCCAAFAINVEGIERLVVAAEIRQDYRNGEAHKEISQTSERFKWLEPNVLVKTIRSAVADEYGIQVHEVLLLRAGTIPKTSSGKIQRHACKARFFERSLALWTE